MLAAISTTYTQGRNLPRNLAPKPTRLVHTYEGSESIRSIAISKNGVYFVVITNTGGVYVSSTKFAFTKNLRGSDTSFPSGSNLTTLLSNDGNTIVVYHASNSFYHLSTDGGINFTSVSSSVPITAMCMSETASLLYYSGIHLTTSANSGLYLTRNLGSATAASLKIQSNNAGSCHCSPTGKIVSLVVKNTSSTAGSNLVSDDFGESSWKLDYLATTSPQLTLVYPFENGVFFRQTSTASSEVLVFSKQVGKRASFTDIQANTSSQSIPSTNEDALSIEQNGRVYFVENHRITFAEYPYTSKTILPISDWDSAITLSSKIQVTTKGDFLLVVSADAKKLYLVSQFGERNVVSISPTSSSSTTPISIESDGSLAIAWSSVKPCSNLRVYWWPLLGSQPTGASFTLSAETSGTLTLQGFKRNTQYTLFACTAETDANGLMYVTGISNKLTTEDPWNSSSFPKTNIVGRYDPSDLSSLESQQGGASTLMSTMSSVDSKNVRTLKNFVSGGPDFLSRDTTNFADTQNYYVEKGLGAAKKPCIYVKGGVTTASVAQAMGYKLSAATDNKSGISVFIVMRPITRGTSIPPEPLIINKTNPAATKTNFPMPFDCKASTVLVGKGEPSTGSKVIPNSATFSGTSSSAFLLEFSMRATNFSTAFQTADVVIATRINGNLIVTYTGNGDVYNDTNTNNLHLFSRLDSKPTETAEFGEILIYNRPITESERHFVEAYLAKKWNLFKNKFNNTSDWPATNLEIDP